MSTIEKVALTGLGYCVARMVEEGIAVGIHYLRRRKIEKEHNAVCERLLNAKTNEEIVEASNELVTFVCKNYL